MILLKNNSLNMSFKSLQIFIIVLFFSTGVNAQFDKKETILRQPTEYENPNGDIQAPTHPEKNKEWIVFSDRDDNKTYKNADENSGEKAVVNFLDAFYVIDEKGPYVHLAKYNVRMKDDANQRKLKKEAVDMGWIKKEFLLLWNHSLVNDKRFKRKALPIIKDEAAFKNPASYIKTGGQLKVFRSPNGDKENDKEVRMFQFLYVFKESGNRILIAKSDVFTPMSVDNQVLGWVPKDIVQPWESRVCLEPNQDEAAVQERKDLNIRANLFLNQDAADNFRSSGVCNDKLGDIDPMEKQLLPDWKRFPILSENPSAKTIETGFITDIIDKSSNQKVINLEQQASANKEFEIIRDNIRQVNIVFVVDGGDGMTEYFPSVITAIDKIFKYNDGSQSNNRLKYGAVVYRDYSDANCPDGDKSVKKSNLTTNYAEIATFLNNEALIHSCNDVEKTQAVNLGLFTALKMLDNSSKSVDQSNIVVLIGGPSNRKDETKYSNDLIAQMMTKVRANMLVFQANNASGEVYRSFVSDMFSNMKNASYDLFKQLNADKIMPKNIPPPVMIPGIDRVKKFDYPKTSAVMGEVIYPTAGSQLSTDILSSEVDSMIELTQIDIERKINRIASQYEGIGDKADNTSVLDPSILIYFHSLGIKIPDQNLVKQYMKSNYQFFIKCYASPDCDKLNNPVFSRVLFVNQDELDELRRCFKNLANETGDINSLRTSMFNAFNEILVTYLGEKEAKLALSNKSEEEVMEMLTGIRKNKGLLTKFTIKDILDSKKVSKEDLLEIQSVFARKKLRLDEISNDPRYKFKSNDEMFFWVPEDALP